MTREELIARLNLLGEQLCGQGQTAASDLLREAATALSSAPALPAGPCVELFPVGPRRTGELVEIPQCGYGMCEAPAAYLVWNRSENLDTDLCWPHLDRYLRRLRNSQEDKYGKF